MFMYLKIFLWRHCSVARILALEKLGAVFNQVSHSLPYTPRKFVIHQESGHLITVETDHNAYTEATKAQRKQTLADVSTAEWWFCLSSIYEVFVVLY